MNGRRENLYRLSPRSATDFFLRTAKPWSGHQISQPIKFQANTTSVGSYSGFDTLSVQQINTRVNATFNLKQYFGSVVLSNAQISVNDGDEKVLDLIATETSSVADDLLDLIGTGLYNDGTANNSKELGGLDALIDDNSGTATYAGLARSTFTTWVSNLDSSSNAITLAELRSSFDAAKIGSDAPTIIVMHPSEWTTYEGLLTPTINYHTQVSGYPKVSAFVSKGAATGQSGDIGFDALFFRGVPVVSDEKQDDGTIQLINEKHLWLAVKKHPKHASVNVRALPGRGAEAETFTGFSFTGFKEPVNQDAVVAQLLWYGELIADSCRHHAYLTSKS